MVYNKVRVEVYNKPSDVVEPIKRAVAEMDYDGIVDLIHRLKCNDTFSLANIGDRELTCCNLEGLVEHNWARFEEGCPPIRVSCYVEPVLGSIGQVIILPPPPAEGSMSRVVMVTLREREMMVNLCRDHLIQYFSPTILMGIA